MTADLASLTGIEVPTGLLIGGEWRPGSAGNLGVTNPATEDTLAEIVSIVAEEAFGSLRGPAVRITTPHIPLPAADALEDCVLPAVERITETVRKTLEDA